jgi:hypothetical protein
LISVVVGSNNDEHRILFCSSIQQLE